MASSDKGRKRDRGHATRDKHTERRKYLKHDDVRIARETADEKDLADEKADQREYSALQNKMEARRIAREIKTAHDTLAALRAEQDILSPNPTTMQSEVPKESKEKKKSRAPRTTVEVAKEGDATGTKRVHKKANAKSQAKGAARLTEATRTAPTRTPARGEDDNSMTKVLGPALVARALRRKVGDARTVAMMKGITECRVELM